MESTFFKVEIDGAIAHLIMNRADKANAMSPDFWADLPRLMRALDKMPDMRAVVISGEGKHFTSGMDLSAFTPIGELSQGEPARGAYAIRDLILYLQDAFNAMEECRLHVILAIHGACLGGGIDFMTAADIRIASEDAYFGIEEIQIGMAADVGTLQRLPKLIAPGIVRELAYTGRRFSAQEALGWGLLNSVHKDKEETLSAALDLAQEIASKAPIAIAGIKNALNYARDHSVCEGLDHIATWNGGMLRPEDLMKAIQARAQKQTAEFADMLPYQVAEESKK